MVEELAWAAMAAAVRNALLLLLLLLPDAGDVPMDMRCGMGECVVLRKQGGAVLEEVKGREERGRGGSFGQM